MVQRVNLFHSQNPSYYIQLAKEFYADQHFRKNLQLIIVHFLGYGTSKNGLRNHDVKKSFLLMQNL